MKDWSECLLSAGKRLKTAQDALTLVHAGITQENGKRRLDEAETALRYALHDVADALAWIRTR